MSDLVRTVADMSHLFAWSRVRGVLTSGSPGGLRILVVADGQSAAVRQGTIIMKKLLGSVAVLALALPLAAHAADLPAAPAYKAPAYVPPPVLTWNGCYIGVNAGGIWGRDDYSLTMGGSFLLPGNIFSNPANSAQLNHSFRSDDTGFTGGGQIGCNWQTAQFVWGVEADINGASRLSDTRSFGPAGPFTGGGALLASSHT